jgi:hypothetical protein
MTAGAPRAALPTVNAVGARNGGACLAAHEGFVARAFVERMAS